MRRSRKLLPLVGLLFVVAVGCEQGPTTEGEVSPGTPPEADLGDDADVADGDGEGDEG
jgi:hypothetical protein